MASISRVTFAHFFQVSQNQSKSLDRNGFLQIWRVGLLLPPLFAAQRSTHPPWCSRRRSCASTTASMSATRTTCPRGCRCGPGPAVRRTPFLFVFNVIVVPDANNFWVFPLRSRCAMTPYPPRVVPVELHFDLSLPRITLAPRSQAECDAINLLAGAKTQSNPENSVGVLSLAGKVPRVLVTPTDDLGVVLNAVHSIGMEGTVNFPTGVQVSWGQLKHLLLI